MTCRGRDQPSNSVWRFADFVADHTTNNFTAKPLGDSYWEWDVSWGGDCADLLSFSTTVPVAPETVPLTL